MHKMLALCLCLVVGLCGLPSMAMGEESILYGEVQAAVPAEGDLSESQALEIARAQFLQVPGITATFVDDMEVTCTFYTHTTEGESIRNWIVFFSPKEQFSAPDYPVEIASPSGEVLFVTDPDAYLWGMEEIAGVMNRDARLAEWEAEKGNYHAWPLADRIAFAVQYEDHDGITPQEGDLPVEDATRIARETVLAQGGISEEALNALVLDVFFQTSYAEDRHREWYISYFDPQTDEQVHVVWINAGTGEVDGYAGPSNSLG